MKKLFIIMICLLWMPLALARGNYSSVDDYATQAPTLKDPKELESLVHFLVRHYKRDDDKARVLLSWIVHNIDYDYYKFQKIVQTDNDANATQEIPQNDILETRLGVCEDIAALYQKMGTLAGLTVEVISGKIMIPDRTLQQFRSIASNHAWNAVKINDKWEYVDPTWAIGGTDGYSTSNVVKKRDYEKTIKRREKRHSDVKKARPDRFILDEWFFTDKDEMIKTHFPNDEKWQLQKKKLTEEEFLKQSNPRAYRALMREKRRGK